MPQALVLGSPIGHSLSPVLHRAAYASLGLADWTYAAAEVDEAAFAAFVAGLGADVRGLSLTMPLKEVAFTVATTVTDRARSAGAINTLVRRADGGWDADNTDIAGIVGALRGRAQVGAIASPAHGLILGAGATARSALVALAGLRVGTLTVAARDGEKARRAVSGLAQSLDLDLRVIPLADWPTAAAELVVSTLPTAGALAAAEALTASGADLSGTRLLDVVYADWPTPLARAAEAAGAAVVSGLDMLVLQAVEQVDLMTGMRPDPVMLLDAGWSELTRRAVG